MIAVDEDTIRRDVRQWSGLVLTGAWVAGWLGGWVAGALIVVSGAQSTGRRPMAHAMSVPNVL